MDQIKLGIGVPAYGGRLAMWHMDMWISMGFALAGSAHRFQLKMRSLVDVCGVEVARNRLISEALNTGVDWLLMIDADTWHDDAFDILQMISSAERAKVNVVAAPVPRRGGDDTHLMIYRGDGAERRPVTGLTGDPAIDEHGFIPIDSAATAMMAIDINFVRAKMTPPWFRFDWVYGSTNFTSEDVSFCERVRAAGGVIKATTAFTAKHLNRPEVLK